MLPPGMAKTKRPGIKYNSTHGRVQRRQKKITLRLSRDIIERKKVASSRLLGSLITQTSERQSGVRQHDSPPAAKSMSENEFVVSQGGHFSDEKSFRDRFNDTFLLFCLTLTL